MKARRPPHQYHNPLAVAPESANDRTTEIYRQGFDAAGPQQRAEPVQRGAIDFAVRLSLLQFTGESRRMRALP
jgi:hypothetical protein